MESLLKAGIFKFELIFFNTNEIVRTSRIDVKITYDLTNLTYGLWLIMTHEKLGQFFKALNI